MRRSARLALGTTALLTAVSGVGAANIYWTGDVNQNWDTGGAGPAANSNWSTDLAGTIDYGKAPLAGDDLFFHTAGATNLSTQVSSAASGTVKVNSVTMLNGSSAVTIGAPNSNVFFVPGSGGVNLQSGAGQLTIMARTPLDVDQTWTNNSNNAIRIGYILGGNKITLANGVLETIAGASVTNTIAVNSGATLLRTTGTSGLRLYLDGGTVDGGGAGILVGYLGGSGGTITNTGINNSVKLYMGGNVTHTYGGVIPSTIRNLELTGINGGSGTQVLSGQNLYWGATLIANSDGKAATLQLVEGNDRLPITSHVTLGITAPTATTTAKLILGGATGSISQTVASLSSSNDPEMVASLVGGHSSISTLTVNNNASNNTAYHGVIGGSGTNENNLALVKSSNGTLTLGGINTYVGDTTVNGGTLALADNAGLRFVIGSNGVNNKITGTGTLNLDGDFTFDLTNAVAASGNSWNIVAVNTLAETFGSTFQVAGFSESANVWTKVVGSATYEFSELTGVLSVTVPEPSTLGLLAIAAGMLPRRRRVDRSSACA